MATAQGYSDVIFLRGGHLSCHFLRKAPLTCQRQNVLAHPLGSGILWQTEKKLSTYKPTQCAHLQRNTQVGQKLKFDFPMSHQLIRLKAAQSDFVSGSAFSASKLCLLDEKTSTTEIIPYIPTRSYAWTEAHPILKLCIAGSQSKNFSLWSES